MIYSKVNESFRSDKQSFFTEIRKPEHSSIDEKRSAINELGKNKRINFLIQNRSLIEFDFNSLSAIANKDQDELLWYCYYCCYLLRKYYISLENKKEVKRYHKHIEDIWALINNSNTEQTKEKKKRFIEFLAEKIKDDLEYIIKSPKHLSYLKHILEKLNLYRLYWTFSRLAVTNALIAGVNFNIIAKLNTLLNKSIDIEKAIQQMNKLNSICNVLSIALFALHASINLVIAVNHIFFPSGKRKNDNEFNIVKRLSQELDTRFADIVNYGWIIINGATNFPALIPVSALAANCLISVFLVVDFLNITWIQQRVKKDYAVIRSNLEQQLNKIRTDKAELEEQIGQPEAELENFYQKLRILEAQEQVINRQMREAQFKYDSTIAMYEFKKKAALLFIIGFITASMLPFAAVGAASYGVIVLGTAFYCVADDFRLYQEMKARYQYAKDKEENLGDARQQFVQARKKFVENILIKGIAPCLILLTLTVCWQAAVVFTALIVAYKLISLYQQNKLQNSTMSAKRLFGSPKTATAPQNQSVAAVLADSGNGINGEISHLAAQPGVAI